MRRCLAIVFGLLIAAGATFGVAGRAAAQKEVVIGLQCDRTGATQTVGVYLCPGYHDYIKLVNFKGGVEGYKIKAIEIDHEYKVPQGMEAYERHKKEGAVLISLYGTPHTQALTQKLTEDRIPGTSPGFGTAAAADGAKYPYIFPIAATYWSQRTAAVKFAKAQLGGSLKGKKIAYLFFDNPAGREPLPIIEDLAGIEGFTLQTFAVPPPGVGMGGPGLGLGRGVGLVWGASEADIEAAGGFGAAEGYNAIQFAGVGQDYPVLNEIREMYKKQGKEPPKEMASTVFYNRGVLIAAVHVEAVRNALKARRDGKITGGDVQAGFEKIKGFPLGGLVPPLEITATDHEGGGWVQIFQAKGGKFVKATEWFKAYPEVLAKHIKAAK